MIDLKNPIIVSLSGISSVFLISIIVLCITNPCYIMEINKKGVKIKNIYLLITYSLLFAVSTGIIILLVMQSINGNKSRMGFVTSTKSFNPRVYSPRT